MPSHFGPAVPVLPPSPSGLPVVARKVGRETFKNGASLGRDFGFGADIQAEGLCSTTKMPTDSRLQGTLSWSDSFMCVTVVGLACHKIPFI